MAWRSSSDVSDRTCSLVRVVFRMNSGPLKMYFWSALKQALWLNLLSERSFRMSDFSPASMAVSGRALKMRSSTMSIACPMFSSSPLTPMKDWVSPQESLSEQASPYISFLICSAVLVGVPR